MNLPADRHCRDLDGATSWGMRKEMLSLESLQGCVQDQTKRSLRMPESSILLGVSLSHPQKALISK